MMQVEGRNVARFANIAAALLTLVGVCRIVATYRVTSVAWDEPCHIAAGLEWIDRGTYTLDPIHPPLARTAIGLPLYLAGERVPQFADGKLRTHDYYEVGTKILYDSGHYLRNLSLARAGVLPFFVLLAGLVFWWTRRLFGDIAGLLAVALLTTTPTILAFSGLAYTDITTACTQFAALFALSSWIEKPSRLTTVVLGLALGLALLSKMTTLLYIPACVAGMFVCKWCLERRQLSDVRNIVSRKTQTLRVKSVLLAVSIAAVVVWGGYRFSVGHVQEAMDLSPRSMPNFQHFPAPVRGIAREAITSNWVVPAPALIQGFAVAWVVNQMRLPSYMFGKETKGGPWYFFLVALAVKTPLPLLILWLAGLFSLPAAVRSEGWAPLAPVVSVLMVLCASVTIQYKEGVRHVLIVLPLLCVVAAAGAVILWQSVGKRRVLGRCVLIGLLFWQCGSSVAAGRDFISYFNVLGGRDPGRIYLSGCDLDCGQDIYRLAEESRRRHIATLNIAVWSAADIHGMGLPPVEILQPFRPVTGWVAISLRSQRLGYLFHTGYPPGAFAWLDQYQPVEHVGKTILLYWIPEAKDSRLGTALK